MASLTAKLTRYPAYKPSGIEWLGEVPANWEVRRLKYLATVNDEILPEDTDPDAEITYVDIGNVDYVKGIIGMEDLAFEDAPSRARRIVRQGDVIISTVRTYLRAIARIESMSTNLIVSTGFAVIRPRLLHDGFTAYALSSPYFVERVVAHSVGVSYPAINASELASLEVAIPPLAEQRAIAAFLDRETAKIDALVSKKERLIELLQEKRTALISHTVTKGLNPGAPMKDSGIEWLGAIPAHWDIKRLKWIADLNPNSTLERTSLSADTPVTFLPMGRVGTEGQIDAGEKVEASKVWNGYTFFRRGDILVAKITPCFENGKGAYLNSLPTDVGFGSTEFHVLRAKPSVHPLFLYRITTDFAFRQSGTESMTGAAGQQRVSADFVANYQIPLPSLDEQAAIATFLDRETAKLNSLVAKVHRAIELIKELRATLISAAVTGKIDVREETVCT